MLPEDLVRYFHFPLFLLGDLFVNKEKTMNNIMHFGIYNFTKLCGIDEEQMARQVCYGMYRGGLTSALEQKVRQYIMIERITYDNENNGFDTRGFNPEQEIDEITSLYQEDREFYNLSFDYYQVKKSLEFYYIKGSIERVFNDAKTIEKIIPANEPYCMINKKHVFEFRDKDKSETEIAELAMFLSMRSILGQKTYCKTNKQLVVSRMFGYANAKQAESKMPKALKPLYEKYQNRYHFDKIKENLELNWHIQVYSNHNRGFYIAVKDEMSMDNLAFAAESNKKKHKISELQAKKQKAKEKAQKRLNKRDDSQDPF